MANSLGLKSNAVAGLGTFSYTVVTAGMYTVDIKTTIPQASALAIAIKLNGSDQVAIGGISTNPTPTQPSMGTSARIACAAGDILAVALTSANGIDNQPNSVKSVITLFQGE